MASVAQTQEKSSSREELWRSPMGPPSTSPLWTEAKEGEAG